MLPRDIENLIVEMRQSLASQGKDDATVVAFEAVVSGFNSQADESTADLATIDDICEIARRRAPLLERINAIVARIREDSKGQN